MEPISIIIPLAALALSAVTVIARRRRRRRLLDLQTGLSSLRALSWRAFEQLAGELFRRQGYRVKLMGGAAPDGGVDLILRRDGEKTIVQCKHWRTDPVGVSLVRELFGVMHAEGARRCIFVTTSGYTEAAQAFARGKPIRLIDGPELARLVAAAQAKPPHQPVAPACPACGRPMIRRVARRGAHAGQAFWGCPRYPACRGRRPLA